MQLQSLSFLFVLMAITSGCAGGPPKRVFPPELSLQELRTEGEQWVAVFRLNSFSDVPMTLQRFDLQFALGEQSAQAVALESALTVSARSVELLDWRFTPNDAWRAEVASAVSLRRSLKYQLDGEIRFSEPSRRFDIEYSSALGPVPGLNGVLR